MTQPQGTIYLVSRAPLDVTYAHTIDFSSADEQYSYWRSKVSYTLSDYSYIRRERRYINVAMTFEDLDGVNYLFFRARKSSKIYYCFVTDREYINDENTRIYFDIDVLQSFMFDYEWKPSYIAQGHVDRWDANHKPKYSYTDEGLDYGSEYITEVAYKIKPDTAIKHGFYLVYCKQHNELVSEGQGSEATLVVNTPIPYDVYLIPDDQTDVDATLENKDNRVIVGFNTGEGIQHKLTSNMKKLQSFMANSAFGEYVVQISYLPYCPFTYEVATNVGVHSFTFTKVNIGDGEEARLGYTILKNDDETRTITLTRVIAVNQGALARVLTSADKYLGLENAIPSAKMWEALKANPYKTERDRRYESKLLCFPYRYNLFTDWTTAPLLVKNEFLFNDKITIKERIGLGFNTPRRYYVENYRKDIEGRECSIAQALPLEQPIISDAYYNYLLQNKNQISANLTNAKINAVHGGVMATVNGAMSGASMGGAWGALGGALFGGATSAISSAIDISNMMRSENAKQSDIKALPDNVTTSNDCSLAIVDDSTFLSWHRRVIPCDSAERLAQYWHMFGYIVKRVEVPNTRSRLRYNYLKTIGANIVGDIESSYLAQIKAIYDKGVTIWHYSNSDFNPLDYTYENIERSLL